MDFYTWLIVGLVFLVILSIPVTFAEAARHKCKKLEVENKLLQLDIQEIEQELKIIKCRQEASQCHLIRIRDEEIERLKNELVIKDKLLNQKWNAKEKK